MKKNKDKQNQKENRKKEKINEELENEVKKPLLNSWTNSANVEKGALTPKEEKRTSALSSKGHSNESDKMRSEANKLNSTGRHVLLQNGRNVKSNFTKTTSKENDKSKEKIKEKEKEKEKEKPKARENKKGKTKRKEKHAQNPKQRSSDNTQIYLQEEPISYTSSKCVETKKNSLDSRFMNKVISEIHQLPSKAEHCTTNKKTLSTGSTRRTLQRLSIHKEEKEPTQNEKEKEAEEDQTCRKLDTIIQAKQKEKEHCHTTQAATLTPPHEYSHQTLCHESNKPLNYTPHSEYVQIYNQDNPNTVLNHGDLVMLNAPDESNGSNMWKEQKNEEPSNEQDQSCEDKNTCRRILSNSEIQNYELSNISNPIAFCNNFAKTTTEFAFPSKKRENTNLPFYHTLINSPKFSTPLGYLPISKPRTTPDASSKISHSIGKFTYKELVDKIANIGAHLRLSSNADFQEKSKLKIISQDKHKSHTPSTDSTPPHQFQEREEVWTQEEEGQGKQYKALPKKKNYSESPKKKLSAKIKNTFQNSNTNSLLQKIYSNPTTPPSAQFRNNIDSQNRYSGINSFQVKSTTNANIVNGVPQVHAPKTFTFQENTHVNPCLAQNFNSLGSLNSKNPPPSNSNQFENTQKFEKNQMNEKNLVEKTSRNGKDNTKREKKSEKMSSSSPVSKLEESQDKQRNHYLEKSLQKTAPETCKI